MNLLDFYNSINKKWLSAHKIPADDTSYSVFDELEEKIRTELIALLQKERTRGTQLGVFVESFYNGRSDDLNTVSVLLQKMDSLDTPIQKIAYLNSYGIDTPISIGVAYDERNTKQFCVHIAPLDLGITKEDYFTETEISKEYKKYLTNVGGLLKIPNFGQTMFALEKSLASLYPATEDAGSVMERYNPMTYERLCAQFPNTDFKTLFQICGIEIPKTPIIVSNIEYMKKIDEFLGSKSKKFWTTWLNYCVYSAFMELLPAPYSSLHFDFYMRIIKGQTKHHSKDYEALVVCSDLAQDSLGNLWVSANSANFVKIRAGAAELYSLVHQAAQKRVLALKWLSEDTRKIAVYKLQKMNLKIGFPRIWLNEFAGLEMGADFMANVLSLLQGATRYEFSKLTEPDERRLWNNSCFDVNAYYYAELNELCVPMGFLGAPFFSLEQSFIKNLAGVGNVMAHEISHGFDEEGHKYDEYGNNYPWWTSIDVELYKVKTRALVKEFDQQKFAGSTVNGELTLGENLADFGAIAMCMDVMCGLWTRTKPTEKQKMADLREFFTAYAVSWAFKNRTAAQVQALKSDSHAPPELRVNVVLRHFKEFYDAFGFTEKDEGWIPPELRIDVWGGSIKD